MPDPPAFPVDPYARVALLLEAGRAALAEAEAAQILAAAPDDPAGHHWLVRCRMDLDDLDGAEAAWHRASQLAPDDEAIAASGVICALRQGRVGPAGDRARRLVDLAGPTTVSAYLMAVTAAWAGHSVRADEWIDRLRSIDAGGETHLLAQAEVGVALCRGRSAAARRKQAEQAIHDLLALDPLDPRAHRLRIRLAQADQGDRRAAEREVTALVGAARVGVVDQSGALRGALLRVLARPALGPTWCSYAAIGFPLVTVTRWWALVLALAMTGWMVTFLAVVHRSRRVLPLLPTAGRARLLRGTTTISGAVGGGLVLLGAVAAAWCTPVTAAHARELRLGVSTREVTRRVATSVTLPGGPGRPRPGPANTSTTLGFPSLPAGSGPQPPLPTPPPVSLVPAPSVVEVRYVRTVEDQVDVAGGLAQLRYLMGAALASSAVGILLVIDARWLRAVGARRGDRPPGGARPSPGGHRRRMRPGRGVLDRR